MHNTSGQGAASRLAVIFAGGESRRLGRDKATAVVGASTLLARTLAAARQVTAQHLLLAGPTQQLPPAVMSEASHGEPPSLRIHRDAVAFAGPMNSLLQAQSVMAESGCGTILLLACDHPFLAPALLTGLCERLEQQTAVDAVIPSETNFPMLLLAAYRWSALQRACQVVQAAGGERLRDLLPQLRVETLPPSQWQAWDATQHSLLQVTTPADLQQAEHMATGRSISKGQSE